MRICSKTRTALISTMVLMLIIGSVSFAFASEPYGPTFYGKLKVSPLRASAGGFVIGKGAGYSPLAEYKVYLDGKYILTGGASKKGAVWFKFNIPDDIKSGIHTVSAVGAAEKGGSLVLKGNIVVGATKKGKLQLSPWIVKPGGSIITKASGLKNLSKYEVYFNNHPVLTGGASKKGAVWFRVTMPKNAVSAYHTISVVGTTKTGEPIELSSRVLVK